MSLKKTAFLALGLAVLIAFYYLYEIRGGEKREQEKEAALKLFHVEEGDISEVIIEREGETIRLVRGDEGWSVKEPLEAKGDEDVMISMLDSLSSGEKDRVVEENPSDLKLYGLDEPAVKITFDAGEKSGTILIGDANPVKTGFYAKRADAPQVVLLSNWTKGRLDRTLYDVRDKTVLPINYDDLKQFSIKGKEEIVVELEKPESWRLTSPISLPADLGKVRDLVNQVNGTKVYAFVEEEPDDYSIYGLDDPAVELTFLLGSNREAKTLYIGAKDEERKGVYARLATRRNVFLLEEGFLDGVPTSNVELRDSKLVRVEYENIQKVQIETAEETVLVEKGERNRWAMRKPFEAKGDRREVDNLIFGVKDLEAKEFVEDNPADLSRYGLSPAKTKITIWEEGREDPVVFLLGAEAEGDGRIYAEVVDEPTVFLVDREKVEQLPLRADEIQNKRLLSFETNDIVGVSIQYPEGALTIKKDNGKWVASEPERFEPVYWKMSDFLWSLHELEFTEVVSEGGAGTEDRQFDHTLAEIRLTRGEDKPSLAIAIGNMEEEETAYAVVEGDQRVYSIDPAFLDRLPKGKEDLT